MNLKYQLIAMTVALALMGLIIGQAAAIPGQPLRLWGEVAAPVADVAIVATIPGVSCAKAVTASGGQYAMNVPADDPDTGAKKEGGAAGDQVSVFVDPGSISLIAFPSGGGMEELNVSTSTTDALSVSLALSVGTPVTGTQRATATGTVTDSGTGLPVSGATVNINWDEESPSCTQVTSAAATGTFTAQHDYSASGSYTVTAVAYKSGTGATLVTKLLGVTTTSTPTGTATPVPTATPTTPAQPTATSAPTATPPTYFFPTATPPSGFTATSTPTAIPSPTATPVPSATPTPTATLAPTPIPPHSLEEATVEDATRIIEDASVTEAAAAIGQISSDRAAAIMEGVEPDRAADIIDEVDADKAADIIREVETVKAAGIMERVETARAAAIMERVETARAAAIMEQVETARAAGIVEQVETARAADIVAGVNATKAGDVLSAVSPSKAGAILDRVPATKMAEIIQVMQADKLTERLPLVSPEKLFAIPAQVLFDAMPRVPVEQLVFEVPPAVDPGLPPPTAVQVTPTLAIYRVPATQELAWAKLVGSPAPIDKILGKFARSLSDVAVSIQDLDEKPEGAPDFAPDQVVSDLFQIGTENVGEGDMPAAHITVYVEKIWLAENQIHRWSILLNRLDPDLNVWVPFPSKRVRETEDRVYYSAVVPGFSVFAITGSRDLPEPVFQVTGLTTYPSSPTPGQSVIIGASVTNTSSKQRVYPATLWVDGVVEATRLVTVGAGVTTPFGFAVKKPAGTYSVRVDRLIGEMVVGVPSTATPTATSTASPTATPTAAPAPSPTVPPTVRPTATPVPSPTPTRAPSPAVTPTLTPLPPAATPTPTPTPAAPPAPASRTGTVLGILLGVLGFLVLVGSVALLLLPDRVQPIVERQVRRLQQGVERIRARLFRP